MRGTEPNQVTAVARRPGRDRDTAAARDLPVGPARHRFDQLSHVGAVDLGDVDRALLVDGDRGRILEPVDALDYSASLMLDVLVPLNLPTEAGRLSSASHPY